MTYETIYDRPMTSEEAQNFLRNCKHDIYNYDEFDGHRSINTCLQCGRQWYPKKEDKLLANATDLKSDA